jgi:MFS transporter, LPLT family, lysophospholipid transporter
MPAGFHRLITTQFVSALADNALLIVAIAVLQSRGLPGWWAPLLKVGFTLSYVLLAPVVGVLADAGPKSALMGWMNAVKALGAALLLLGLHPVAAFCVIGFGAAAYAPAKYGLVTELVGPERLVAANGWLEVSVVGAVLLGTVAGGLLVGPAWQGSMLAQVVGNGLASGLAAVGGVAAVGEAGAGLSGPHAPAMVVLLGVYALSAVLNLGVPDSGARYAQGSRQLRALARDFFAANRRLWRDRDAGLSLSVTTLFWGVGATLQFAVLHWAAEALGLALDEASRLQGLVAIGVVLGAAAAGRFVPLASARRVMGVGVLLGALMPVVAWCDALGWAVPLLMAAGAAGGLMVVPLNALLQHRGCQLLGAGQSIAVQGYNENASVLLMLGLYAGLLAMGWSSAVLMSGLGALVAVLMLLLIRRDRRR